jgi:sugar/nucleoside kinase (ribokinase family)
VADRRFVGLGRVCVDAYYRRAGAAERWDGRKWGVRPETEALGGSVPRLLHVLRACGATCDLLGTANPDDAGGRFVVAELARLGVTPRLRPCRRTARSWVVVDDVDRLQLVCSVAEDPDDRFPRASIRDVDLDDVWGVVLDPRHLEAATALAIRCGQEGVPVFLDPGTSAYHAYDVALVQALYAHVDVVCADRAFFEWIGETDGPATVLTIHDTGATTATCLDGDVTVAVPDGELVGSSLGCGDAFRGGILAGLLAQATTREALQRPSVAAMERALRLGRRFATHRKTDAALLPRLPAPEPIAAWLAEARNGPADTDFTDTDRGEAGVT